MEYLKCFHKRCSDRIGLNHISHKAQRKNNKYREQSGKRLSECSLERRLDVVDRTSCHLTVYLCLICLCQNCLSVDRRHSEECTDPHPEDRARASADEGGRCSGKISCTYLGCDGCRDGLERSHLAFFVLLTVHAEMPEYLTDALPELSDLDKSQADRIVKSGSA